MKRVLEPELMDNVAQAGPMRGRILPTRTRDLSIGFENIFLIGPAGMYWMWDVGLRISPSVFSALSRCASDGRGCQPSYAGSGVRGRGRSGLADKVTLRCARFQALTLPDQADALLSNSLLHHVSNPAPVLVSPETMGEAGSLYPDYGSAAAGISRSSAIAGRTVCVREDPLLKRDFFNSLLAAFTEDEVASQLAQMNLSRLLIDVPDDRHWVVGGVILNCSIDCHARDSSFRPICLLVTILMQSLGTAWGQLEQLRRPRSVPEATTCLRTDSRHS